MDAFNLVHLDIKPTNLMSRTSQDEIVLIDFGLSKHLNISDKKLDLNLI